MAPAGNMPPQAIIKWGIQAIIGESFAEIFLGNCLANGVPCVTADHSQIAQLQKAIGEDPNLTVSLNLVESMVTYGDRSFPVIISDGALGQISVFK